MLCSIVCMTPTGKILCIKGGPKATFPNLWTCGVFETNENEMLETTAKDFYMREFNADIDIICQPAGDMHRPIPISLFTANGGTEEKPRYVEGICIAAILRNPSQIVLNDRYTDYKVLDLVELATEIGPIDNMPDLFFNIITVLDTFYNNNNNSQEATNPTDSLNIEEENTTEEIPAVEDETLNMSVDTEIKTVEE